MAHNKRLKLTVALAWLLRTSKRSVFIRNRGADPYVEERTMTRDDLENICLPVQLSPDVLEEYLGDLQGDARMQKEIGPYTLGIINYIEKKFKTSQIWELKDPSILLCAPHDKAMEMACEKVQRATPRGVIV